MMHLSYRRTCDAPICARAGTAGQGWARGAAAAAGLHQFTRCSRPKVIIITCKIIIQDVGCWWENAELYQLTESFRGKTFDYIFNSVLQVLQLVCSGPVAFTRVRRNSFFLKVEINWLALLVLLQNVVTNNVAYRDIFNVVLDAWSKLPNIYRNRFMWRMKLLMLT